jgi:hypothetical protein
MSFDKYLNKRQINKVIDPHVGTTKPVPVTVIENTPERTIPRSGFKILVSDLIAEARITQSEIQSTINEIYTVSSSDSGFREYYEMVKANHFDALELLKNPKAKPPEKYTSTQIKAAERDVYRRIVDPRAPFVQDLYFLKFDAGVSEYALTRVWDKLLDPNELYDKFPEDDRLVRYAISKEAMHIRQIRESSHRIKKNKTSQFVDEFLSVLAHKLISRIQKDTPRSVMSEISTLVRLLRQIRAVLQISTVFNNENWEKFSGSIKDIYGDYLNYVARKLVTTQAYAIYGGVQSKIGMFTNEIDQNLPLGLRLDELPSILEFKSQIDSVFYKNLAKIEDDLLAKEEIAIKMEESRQLMYLNSRKNHRTKQYMDVLSSAISYLESARYALENTSTFTTLAVERLIATLNEGAVNYMHKVAVAPKQESMLKSEDPLDVAPPTIGDKAGVVIPPS